MGGRVGAMRLGPVRCCALTVLRHPVSTRARIANPAIHAARVVSPSTESARVADTQLQTIVVPGQASSARAEVRAPRARDRWWAIPMLVIAGIMLAGIGVLAVLPSSLVADEPNPRTGGGQATPYPRTP